MPALTGVAASFSPAFESVVSDSDKYASPISLAEIHGSVPPQKSSRRFDGVLPD